MSIKFSTGAMAAILSTGSMRSVFANGVMRIFSGPQVVDADASETGEILTEVTLSGGAFTPGATTNGLNFGTTTDSTIAKAPAETWLGNFIKDGTMGWFRFYDNSRTTGASTSAVRIDGRVGTSRADIIVVTTAATVGGSVSFNDFKFDFTII